MQYYILSDVLQDAMRKSGFTPKELYLSCPSIHDVEHAKKILQGGPTRKHYLANEISHALNIDIWDFTRTKLEPVDETDDADAIRAQAGMPLDYDLSHFH